MATATVTHSWTTAIEVLRAQGAAIRGALHRNVDGMTHDESLLSPRAGGNCLNWVLGHLDCTNEATLGVLSQPAVLGEAAFARYKRGSAELHEAGEAMPLEDLLNAWDEQWAQIDKGLAGMTAEKMEAPAPWTPRKKADETVGSLLTALLFHQAYHVGQTAILRRIAGHEGAIK
jgi:uncharacterized damage-inducible protein DinB